VRKSNLEVQLAKYLRKARGEMSYLKFSKKIGVSHTTLHRLEKGEHHLTIYKLETIMDKLKIKLADIFPDEF
jgi:transcriptional regulator with XRE-family HTH domain